MTKRVTKIEKFKNVYQKEILNGDWITKDDMAKKGFFPKKNTNGRDIRFIKSRFIIEEHREGNRIPKFRVLGKNLNPVNRNIKKNIYDDIRSRKCVMLNTKSDIEVDHKNGRYNDSSVNIDKQTSNDFQPLTKSVNNIKREVCKKCKDTDKKFDAKNLNFLISNLNGEYEHDGSPNGCEGCFFYDIKHFKEAYNNILIYLLNNKIGFSEDIFFETYSSIYNLPVRR